MCLWGRHVDFARAPIAPAVRKKHTHLAGKTRLRAPSCNGVSGEDLAKRSICAYVVSKPKEEGLGGGDLAIDVLIAEDEPSILEALDFVLKRAGWSISAVMDGEAVMDAVRRLQPRVLVLDIMLPKRSGFEVLKQIRADRSTSALPVLVLTAKGQQQDRRIAEELGADRFVTKPYSNADVVSAVRSLLGETSASSGQTL